MMTHAQAYAVELRRNLKLVLAEAATRERTHPLRRSHISLNGVHYQAAYADRNLTWKEGKGIVVEWTIHVYRCYNQRKRWKRQAKGRTLLRALRKAGLLEARVPV